MFTFGSKIGQITNRGTIAYSLLPNIEKEYGKDSEQYKLIISRLKQSCVAQSKQIDKGKIGREVKSIPRCWVEKHIIADTDNEEQIKYKKIMNDCLLSKYPYFFKYKYRNIEKRYNEHYSKYNLLAQMRFDMSIKDLLSKTDKNQDEAKLSKDFYLYSPVVDSDCSMNLLCKILESNFEDIKLRIKKTSDFDYSIYKFKNIEYTKNEYNRIIQKLTQYKKDVSSYIMYSDIYNHELENNKASYISFADYISFYDIRKVINILIDYCYSKDYKFGKQLLWNEFGENMCENIYNNIVDKKALFPFVCKNKNYDFEYLGKKYCLQEINL